VVEAEVELNKDITKRKEDRVHTEFDEMKRKSTEGRVERQSKWEGPTFMKRKSAGLVYVAHTSCISPAENSEVERRKRAGGREVWGVGVRGRERER
jgi:hypothetical protein